MMENGDNESGSLNDLSDQGCALLQHLGQLHTTRLGAERIQRNLSLQTDDVICWCRELIRSGQVSLKRQGKNWYAQSQDCVITVNASSYTIITAHRIGETPKHTALQKD